MIAHRIQTELLCTKKAVPFLGKISDICSNLKAVKVILKTWKKECSFKKEKEKKNSCRCLKWFLFCLGEWSALGMLGWWGFCSGPCTFSSNQVKRKHSTALLISPYAHPVTFLVTIIHCRPLLWAGKDSEGDKQQKLTLFILNVSVVSLYTLAYSCKDHTRLDRNFLE